MHHRTKAGAAAALWLTMMTVAGFPLAGEINLSAAASLKDALGELTSSYARTRVDVTFITNFGGSGAVAKQIENGAPADLFISANTEWIDYLEEKGLLDAASVGTFAYNTLVFVAPPGMTAAGLKDLSSFGRIAIGSPKSVPAGDYAVKAFAKAGIEKDLEGRLIMAKDVRECLAYAEKGEVDGAFAYRTDALLSPSVSILFTVPRELSPRVTYPMALTVAGARNPDATAFIAYLAGPEARAALARFGFETE